MFKWREEHFYLGYILILTLLEFCLAIPFFIPLFDGNMLQIYLVIAMLHILGFLFLLSKQVDIRPFGVHLLGVSGFFISVIPIFHFIFHGYICWRLIKVTRELIQYIKTNYK